MRIIHYSYKNPFPTTSLFPGSEGKILTGQSKLNVHDLDIIGKLAFNRGFYDRATEWLEAAMAKAVEKSLVQTLEHTLKTMKNKHDQVQN